MPELEAVRELRPEQGIRFGVRVGEPNTKDVINKPFIEYEMFFPLGDKGLLMKRIEDSCPWWCRGNAHACSGDLSPVCITNDNTVVEDNM